MQLGQEVLEATLVAASGSLALLVAAAIALPFDRRARSVVGAPVAERVAAVEVGAPGRVEGR